MRGLPSTRRRRHRGRVPDLAALTDRSPEALLVAILDPNRAFEAKYADFTIQTTDGRVLNGLVAAETGSAVTIRRPEGKEDVLLRSEIDAMAASGRSLMPEGLENDIKPQDLADLIGLSEQDRAASEAGRGQPPRAGLASRPTGRSSSAPETAQIFGETLLTFEAEHRNLGYWGRPVDRAAWTFEVAQAGRYAIWLDWACDDVSAGNTLRLDFGTDRASTEDLRDRQLGDVPFGEGRRGDASRPARTGSTRGPRGGASGAPCSIFARSSCVPWGIGAAIHDALRGEADLNRGRHVKPPGPDDPDRGGRGGTSGWSATAWMAIRSWLVLIVGVLGGFSVVGPPIFLWACRGHRRRFGPERAPVVLAGSGVVVSLAAGRCGPGRWEKAHRHDIGALVTSTARPLHGDLYSPAPSWPGVGTDPAAGSAGRIPGREQFGIVHGPCLGLLTGLYVLCMIYREDFK